MKIAQQLKQISMACDRLSLIIGKALSWLSVAMVLISSAVVLVRLCLGIGSIAAQEAIVYAHATLFMLCLGFNLQQNAHVRVDVFYHHFSEYTRAWVNSCGTILFLLPFAFFLMFVSGEFVERAWQVKEGSIDPGGLPYIYLLKTLIPTAGLLLGIQGLGEVFKNLYIIYSAGPVESD